MKRRVRVAMLDSGVFTGNAHIQRAVEGGVTIRPAGEETGYEDALGHGTAVCALLQQMAPEAALFAVKIFDKGLATNLSIVLRAIEWCVQEQMDIINLSLGTANEAHRDQFVAAVARVRAAGMVMVSACELNGSPMLPGSLSGVVGVIQDPSCPRDSYRVIHGGTTHLAACPYPLDIVGVPRERNIHGVSFAVAHISAHIARAWPTRPPVDWCELLGEGSKRLIDDSVRLAESTAVPSPDLRA